MNKDQDKKIYRKGKQKKNIRFTLISIVTAIGIFSITNFPAFLTNVASNLVSAILPQLIDDTSPITTDASGTTQLSNRNIEGLVPSYKVMVTNGDNASLRSAYKCDQVYEFSIFIDNVDSHSMRLENVRLNVLEYTPIDHSEYAFSNDLGGGSDPPLAYYYADIEPCVQSFYGTKISDEAICSLDESSKDVVDILLNNKDVTSVTNIASNTFCQLCFLFRIKEPGVYKYVIEADYTLGGSDIKTLRSDEHADVFLEQNDYNNKIIDIYNGMLVDANCVAYPLEYPKTQNEWHLIKTGLTSNDLHAKLLSVIPYNSDIREEYFIDEYEELFAIVDHPNQNGCSLWFANATSVIKANIYESIDVIDTSSGLIFLGKLREDSSDTSIGSYEIIQERAGIPIRVTFSTVENLRYLGNDQFELTINRWKNVGNNNYSKEIYTVEGVWNGICFIEK